MARLLENKKVRFDYEILETIEAGIVLHGFEVKSLKSGRGIMAGAFVVFEDDVPALKGLSIPPYQENNTPDWYDPKRKRNLLITKKDIERIRRKKLEAGMSLVPLNIHTKGNLVKVEVALVRGKKKHDKRETIKKRDTERDLQRTLKG